MENNVNINNNGGVLETDFAAQVRKGLGVKWVRTLVEKTENVTTTTKGSIKFTIAGFAFSETGRDEDAVPYEKEVAANKVASEYGCFVGSLTPEEIQSADYEEPLRRKALISKKVIIKAISAEEAAKKTEENKKKAEARAVTEGVTDKKRSPRKVKQRNQQVKNRISRYSKDDKKLYLIDAEGKPVVDAIKRREYNQDGSIKMVKRVGASDADFNAGQKSAMVESWVIKDEYKAAFAKTTSKGGSKKKEQKITNLDSAVEFAKMLAGVNASVAPKNPMDDGNGGGGGNIPPMPPVPPAAGGADGGIKLPFEI